jgi:hypothetical protein
MYEMIVAPDLQRRFATDRQGLMERAPSTRALPVQLHSLSGQHIVLPLRKRKEFYGHDVLEV